MKFLVLINLLVFLGSFAGCDIKEKTRNKTSEIHINQLGYYINSPKNCIIVNSGSNKFYLIDSFTGKQVYSGELNNSGNWQAATDDNFQIGDFTNYSKPGSYYIYVESVGKSHTFNIKRNLYKDVLKAAMKAFYYQRASIDIKKKYAGDWSRKKGHPDNSCYLYDDQSRKIKISTPGGWYDAGDYGKYVVNGGISACTLLSFYEMFPNILIDELNIPESKNKISDLLDEVKYEVDWMKTMQDKDGGVYFKVGPTSWPGFILPVDDLSDRYVIGKSTTSTLNFVAVMAQFSRIFKKYNRRYAKDCVLRAEKAWQWAVSNPAVKEPAEGHGTGLYDDKVYADEFIWAAAELFITTGKINYKTFLENKIGEPAIKEPANWSNVLNLAYFSLVTHKTGLNEILINKINQQVINFADSLLVKIKENPFRVPMNKKDFVWGSNGNAGNYGISLIYAYNQTGDMKYVEALYKTADYIFGKNATGYSFVTGYGSRTPMKPHHRLSGASAVKFPIPGFLVGGPNRFKDDGMSFYTSNDAAKAYADHQGSYASNEVAINWNAPLVFILGFLENYK